MKVSMKANENATIYAGGDDTALGRQALRSMERNGEGDGKTGTKTIFAGDLGIGGDAIAAKRQTAQKKALKAMSDAWNADYAVDDEIELHRENAKKLRADRDELNALISEIRDNEKLLQEQDGAADGSEQQKELDNYMDQLNELDLKIEQEYKIISGIKLERLKSTPMVAARKEAEKIMDSAGKEILGMLVDEGREHIDEEQKEEQEKAKEAKEKKEEQEALIEKRKEEKEDAEKLTEEILEGAGTASGKSIEEVRQEVKDLVARMKLVEEDIKGAQVDESL